MDSLWLPKPDEIQGRGNKNYKALHSSILHVPPAIQRLKLAVLLFAQFCFVILWVLVFVLLVLPAIHIFVSSLAAMVAHHLACCA